MLVERALQRFDSIIQRLLGRFRERAIQGQRDNP